jgi:hypothetical protein
MSLERSAGGGPKRRHPRFTPARKQAFVKYYNIHGWKNTLEHFKISGSALTNAIKAKDAPVYRGNSFEKPDRTQIGKNLYFLAKKLRSAIIEARSKGGEPTDLELYAWFIIREILK